VEETEVLCRATKHQSRTRNNCARQISQR
jgi:hypothetical protein